MQRIWIILLVTLIINLPAINSIASEKDESLATDAAYSFLTLLDNGETENAFENMSIVHKKIWIKEWWVKKNSAEREFYGELINRSIKRLNEATTLPGHPDGKYFKIQFETSFENKAQAFEMVYVMLGSNNEWKVTEYFSN